MGKGFQNFMSKKDFHPSAWWNLKKKWEAEQEHEMKQKREEEMRQQYEKEQEMLNNKALLGDEKAKLGLSFMYDAPVGMTKREEDRPEPKFEWQRKYNAPREAWAKGNDAIQDQPFGIQVRNVRCVKCRTWGHLNTDRECPLYGMSGNADNPGYSNNPSELIREVREKREQEAKVSSSKSSGIKASTKPTIKEEPKRKRSLSTSSTDSTASDSSSKDKREPIGRAQLLEDMREEHNLKFKAGVLRTLRAEEEMMKLGQVKKEPANFDEFLKGLSKKKQKKLMAKIMGTSDGKSKKSKKHKKEKKHKSSKRERMQKSKRKSKISRELDENLDDAPTTSELITESTKKRDHQNEMLEKRLKVLQTEEMGLNSILVALRSQSRKLNLEKYRLLELCRTKQEEHELDQKRAFEAGPSHR